MIKSNEFIRVRYYEILEISLSWTLIEKLHNYFKNKGIKIVNEAEQEEYFLKTLRDHLNREGEKYYYKDYCPPYDNTNYKQYITCDEFKISETECVMKDIEEYCKITFEPWLKNYIPKLTELVAKKITERKFGTLAFCYYMKSMKSMEIESFFNQIDLLRIKYLWEE